MPIYVKIEGIKGDVAAGGAAGGVWKTTNFLTTDRAGRSGGGPHAKIFDGSDGAGRSAANLIPVSSISQSLGEAGVEGRDAAAKLKVEQLIRTVRTKAPNGRLYVATDSGVFAGSSNNRGKLLIGVDGTRSASSNPRGRLLAGTDQGLWRNKPNASNNLKQLGLGVHGPVTVEIVVTDFSGTPVASHRLPNVSVSGTAGTFTLTFNGQTTGG